MDNRYDLEIRDKIIVIQMRRTCQRGLAALLLLFAAAAVSRAAELAPVTKQVSGFEVGDLLRRLSRMHVGGSLSLNWRNVGPRKPGFETQIQNQVYLADMYFGIDGPFVDGVPFQIELHMPTASQGVPRLNQLNFGYRRVDHMLLQFGKFVVPYGRYNELYRPDQFLTITRPLLYASPDSLDLVVRLNSPRPPISAGYTDVGGRLSYYPPKVSPIVPDELTFFVVNGLGEQTNRLRTFPNTDNLGIASVPGNGTNIDFGHANNNLADNNNFKSVGGRIVFSLGDVRFPWPIPEGASDLKGMNFGVSGMGGQYDLEGQLSYQMYSGDLSFDYLGFNVSGEYQWSSNRFLAPLIDKNAAVVDVDPIEGGTQATQMRDFEVNRGWFVQVSAPILRHPRFGERLTGIFVYNQMERRGPIQDLLLNPIINGTTFPSVNGLRVDAERATTWMKKYTTALHYQLSEHFALKFDYSYWEMGHASTRSVNSLGLVDIYQGAFAMVMAF